MSNSWDTNPWNEQPAPQTREQGWDQPPQTQQWGTAAAPPQRRRGAAGILVALIAVLAVAIAGVVAYLFLNGNLGGNGVATSSPGTIVVESTVVETAGPVADDAGEDAPEAAPAPAATATRAQSQPRPQQQSSGLPAAAQSAGLTLKGWSDNSATRCHAAEGLIYAGKGDNAWVTVCGEGGQLTYRSDVFGGTLAMPVDMSQSDPANGYFVIPASPSNILLSGDRVLVYQDDILVASENLPEAWIID